MERRTPGPDREQRILMADLARAYYVEDRSKVDLATRFGLSRFQVAKLLRSARENGVVSIAINDPRRPSLDDDLAHLLGIDRVQVVDVADVTARQGGERVGTAVMTALTHTLRPRTTVGISWSRTMDLAARSMPDLPPCTIVQLAGALQIAGSGTLPQVIGTLGGSAEITTLPIHAPLVVDNASTARDLMRQPEIAEALDRADRLDLAVVAIGGWSRGESSVWEKVAAGDRDEAAAGGAVGEISGRLFNAEGRHVTTSLDDRLIGVRIDQLAATPQVIAVAHGAGRAEAVVAAARAGFVTHLVVDSTLAEALVGLLDRRP
ncbi:sugar-binding transcriptional regulator [Frigoribacterium faeni]|uniref:Transcriptional regulator n=1 Tax=Frigoribacterium faeni TaxID=145483 RepID=A0A7W3JJS8_9MICO|nr:sugar-binding domain-containing protein [Frigoribacterium faeni]MBA8814133.1 DNA-binding transcriptional regulator LsrR (DeoR family) [Frigoribacterium faeni]GEK82725.1 transcriptional regulator [Frigoribacterium faeni]